MNRHEFQNLGRNEFHRRYYINRDLTSNPGPILNSEANERTEIENMNEVQKAKIAMEVARWGQDVIVLGQDAGGTIWIQLEARGPVHGIDRMGDWSRARFYEAKRLQKVVCNEDLRNSVQGSKPI